MPSAIFLHELTHRSSSTSELMPYQCQLLQGATWWSRNTMKTNPINNSQTDTEWLALQMHKCTQNSQKLLGLQRWTLIWGWSTHERWMSHHPSNLQRLYYGWFPQESSRNQQGLGLGKNVCLLTRNGSWCDRLHKEMSDMHREQQSACRDTTPSWGPSRTLGQVRYGLLSWPSRENI